MASAPASARPTRAIDDTLVYKIQFIQDILCGDGSPMQIDLSPGGVEGLYFFLDDIKNALTAADEDDGNKPNLKEE